MRLSSFALPGWAALSPCVVVAFGCGEMGEPAAPAVPAREIDSAAPLPRFDAALADLPDTSAGPGKASASGLPCDIQQLLTTHCTSCHGAPLGAPMRLLDHADLNAPSPSNAALPVYRRVQEKLRDTVRPMPPVSTRDSLSREELAAFDRWVAAGAPRSSESCLIDAGPPAAPEIVDTSQCDFLIELRAHAAQTADDDSPFPVPSADDHNECFHFALPWGDEQVQALRFDPIIDDGRVVHHWILSSLSEARAPGSHDSVCSQAARTYMAGWAPGTGPLIMPADVGYQMPSGSDTVLQLELHYNNVARVAGAADRSGVRICATRKQRPKVAAMHTLGLLPFIGPQSDTQELRNGCQVVSSKGPATTLRVMPHMHRLGRHISALVTRPNGEEHTLLNVPFDFRDQGSYPTDLVIQPGDVITTTCTYENDTGLPVYYGEKTSDEMCFLYVLAHPVGSLVGGAASLFKDNACIGAGEAPLLGL